MSRSPVEDLWLAIGHIRAAKTKMAAARLDHRPLSPVLYDLLRLEARELRKTEEKLITWSKKIQAEADAAASPAPASNRGAA